MSPQDILMLTVSFAVFLGTALVLSIAWAEYVDRLEKYYRQNCIKRGVAFYETDPLTGKSEFTWKEPTQL